MVCTYTFLFSVKNLIDVYLSKTLLLYIVWIAGCGITRDELVLLGEKYSKPELLLLLLIIYLHVFSSFPVFNGTVFVMLLCIVASDAT